MSLVINVNGPSFIMQPAMTINLQRLDMAKILEKLTDLLYRYRDWDDNLSTKIHDWGLEAIDVDISKMKGLNPRLEQLITEKITELKDSILVNPLTLGTLVAPVIEQDTWEWEESAIQDHINCNLSSPFSFQPIREYRSHDFAREVIAWLDTYFSTNPPSVPILGLNVKIEPKEDLSLVPANAQIIIPAQYRDIFVFEMTLAQSHKNKIGLWNLRRRINEYAIKSQQNFRMAIAEIERRAQIAKQQAQENEQVVNDRIQQTEQAHANTVKVMKTRIQDVQENLSKAKAETEVALQTCAELGQQVQVLHQQFRQAQEEIYHLRNQDSSSCSIQ